MKPAPLRDYDRLTPRGREALKVLRTPPPPDGYEVPAKLADDGILQAARLAGVKLMPSMLASGDLEGRIKKLVEMLKKPTTPVEGHELAYEWHDAAGKVHRSKELPVTAPDPDLTPQKGCQEESVDVGVIEPVSLDGWKWMRLP